MSATLLITRTDKTHLAGEVGDPFCSASYILKDLSKEEQPGTVHQTEFLSSMSSD